MICKAHVNRIVQFTSILHVHLEDAHAGIPEPELLTLLKWSRQVTYLDDDTPLSRSRGIKAMYASVPVKKVFVGVLRTQEFKTHNMDSSPTQT